VPVPAVLVGRVACVEEMVDLRLFHGQNPPLWS
jgi:hypothetical protein